MNTLDLPAPAKLNLFLHITGRRDGGYHELQTLFQFLDHSDRLRITPRSDGRIRVYGPEWLPSGDNLITRAADRLRARTGTSAGADIELTKILPAGGGLGGGSSDAATALVGLNHLWETGLSRSQLATLGLELGADVPVFIHGVAAWGEGVGEQLTPVLPPEHWYLVLAPEVEVSTAQIFAHPDLTRDTPKSRIRTAFEGSDGFRNDCEPIVRQLYPAVDQALEWLGQYGEARLTGTGGCVFCSFETQSAAIDAHAEKPSGINGFIAQSRNRSPLYTQLGELD
ncbi:4-(cytidine 5'-diphospho)-2-C-methyl-D-erythritol kinase [Halovibrio salipaludis]|uniref:4-diphosphocytidyl-2-C-methyl-D-erythritol kinase n=1 Tax=Halovibrio salipaludis TaxID=2032626 RepID=A0A2A2F351_9GAMM|nr:4-(cytidine 5'-diphospho)-2-C-methyl-D-erythritol kinase [Halovibrio salipaludis]PAU80031.1 4-(cytidine 5'-diphospho)-2-C-methyl-D-erythritol kinase [Halovibrio salipaludis]